MHTCARLYKVKSTGFERDGGYFSQHGGFLQLFKHYKVPFLMETYEMSDIWHSKEYLRSSEPATTSGDAEADESVIFKEQETIAHSDLGSIAIIPEFVHQKDILQGCKQVSTCHCSHCDAGAVTMNKVITEVAVDQDGHMAIQTFRKETPPHTDGSPRQEWRRPDADERPVQLQVIHQEQTKSLLINGVKVTVVSRTETSIRFPAPTADAPVTLPVHEMSRLRYQRCLRDVVERAAARPFQGADEHIQTLAVKAESQYANWTTSKIPRGPLPDAFPIPLGDVFPRTATLALAKIPEPIRIAPADETRAPVELEVFRATNTRLMQLARSFFGRKLKRLPAEVPPIGTTEVFLQVSLPCFTSTKRSRGITFQLDLLAMVRGTKVLVLRTDISQRAKSPIFESTMVERGVAHFISENFWWMNNAGEPLPVTIVIPECNNRRHTFTPSNLAPWLAGAAETLTDMVNSWSSEFNARITLVESKC